MKRLILAGSLLLSGSSWGAVALNNVGTADHVTANTYSAPFSVTAGGSNIAAFVALSWLGDAQTATVASISYGGNTMTACGSISRAGTSGGAGMQWFYLANPPTGSNTLAITVSGTTNPTELYVNMISFTGVDQATPVRSGTYEFTTSSAATGVNSFTEAINSDPTDLTVSSIGDDTGISSTNQTQEWSNTLGTMEQYGDMATTPAASVTHTWTFIANNANFVWAGFSVKSAAPAAPPATFTIRTDGISF